VAPQLTVFCTGGEYADGLALMRTRGWGGVTPASDEEAAQRILTAAKTMIDNGEDVNIADIARTVGITRQTVYRYYPSTDSLLMAAALDSARGFLDGLAEHIAGITDPAHAVVEAMAYTLEALPEDHYIGLLLSPERSGAFSARITSDTSVSLAHSMLHRFAVDWEAEGFNEDDIDELSEHTLRTMQSFVLDPGYPPRTGDELRAYFQRWIGTALRHRNCAQSSQAGPRRRSSRQPKRLDAKS
jgi:AcrR family transcriptional regulator